MPKLFNTRSRAGRRIQARAGSCFIALLLLVATAARAELQFDVFIGYDGMVREASWTPFLCELKNDGLPIKGFIEIAPAGGSKGQTYSIPVELPTGTMKRVTIPVYASGRYAGSWNVRLTNERGKVLAEKNGERPRRQVGWETPLLGSLARTAAGAPSLRAIPGEQNENQPTAVRLQPAIFPDNPIVLEGLNALYLSSDAVAGLRSSQVNAILAWLNEGGHLIVGVEQISDITAAPWLKGVLPCEPKDMKTIAAHTELQSWLRSPLDYKGEAPAPQGMGVFMQRYGTGRPNRPRTVPSPSAPPSQAVGANAPFANLADDADFELKDLQVVTGTVREGRVLVTSSGVPLIVTTERGRGRVTALMFSPEREPFKSWKNLSSFWARMAEVPGWMYVAGDNYRGNSQSPDGIFGAMIDSRQIHKLPLGWLLLLLVIYLAVIGPFDQWWLKKIGKPMLTWVTFPCYVALFSLLIYFIGYKLRAGESEYNELHLVDVLRNGAKAELRGRTFASIYAPNNARFGMLGKQRYATLRGEVLGFGAEVAERGTIEQTGDAFKAEVYVPVWTSQLFISDWWQGAALPLEVSVQDQGTQWTATVKNNSEHALKVANLVLQKQIYALGEIAAGQTRQFVLKPDGGLGLADFVARNGGRNFFQVIQRRQNAFGASGHIDDLGNSAAAASFLSELQVDQYNNSFVLTPGLDLGAYLERGGAVLLAWAPDERPTEPMNQFKPKRQASSTLWRVPVQVTEAK